MSRKILMMESAEPGIRSTRRKILRTSAGGLAVTVLWVAHMAARSFYQPGEPVRLALTLGLTLTFGLFVLLQFQLVSALDEFQRQVHATALAIAFPLSLVAIFAFGFLAREGLFVASDPRDLAGLMVFFYLIGYLVAHWRYR